MKKVIRSVVSMSLLVIALYLLDWKGLKAAVLRVNIWQFSLATGISLFIFSLMSLRWYELIRKVPLSRIHHSRHYFYSIFLNIMTPANIGGDVYRFLALKDHKADKSFVAVALVRERLAGLLAYLLTFLICYSGLWIFNPAFRGLSFLFFAFFGYFGIGNSYRLVALHNSPDLCIEYGPVAREAGGFDR